MARSAKENLMQSRRPVARPATERKSRPDAIEKEFLRLWLTISRLREHVLRNVRAPSARARAKPTARIAPVARKPRGRAA